MNRYLLRVAAASFAVCLSLLTCTGCDFGAKRIKPPAISAAKAAKAAVEEYDADKDGKISGVEFDKCPSLKHALSGDAAKGDGITAETIKNMLDGWQSTKLGRVNVTCQVFHNGKPYPNATVTFVPEKFLGKSFQTAVGKTDVSGCAEMCIPNATPPGLALGLYRVEITKENESVPAKYNTETILGVAVTRVGSGVGAAFNMKY